MTIDELWYQNIICDKKSDASGIKILYIGDIGISENLSSNQTKMDKIANVFMDNLKIFEIGGFTRQTVWFANFLATPPSEEN